MGKGAITESSECFEGKCSTHGQPLSASGASFAKTIEALGGSSEKPFVLFDETKELYAQREKELETIAKEKKAEQAEWTKKNPELAEKLDYFLLRQSSKS